MANLLDLPTAEAEEILSLKKQCPETSFRETGHGKQSYYLLAVGVISDGEYKRALTVEITCRVTAKPNRSAYKFTLFKEEHGRKRVYQLDVFIPPICQIDEHDWPHEHIGQGRRTLGKNYPSTFQECLEYFCKKTNITFEVIPESPLEFSLRPNK